MKTYRIEYTALVYNLPLTEEFDFLDHKFVVNQVTDEVKNALVLEQCPLMMNTSFISCCYNDSADNMSFVSLKNITPILQEYKDCEDIDSEKITQMVCEKLSEIEKHLIFITNVHIFFPIVYVKVYSPDGLIVKQFGNAQNRPLPHYKWNATKENIDLNRRLGMGIDKKSFDKFTNNPKRVRYKKAFDYYIRSFFEYDHSSAFCLLCSAVDAITGNNKSGLTKKRLGKYSSVLFCEPLSVDKNDKIMQKFYKLRSDFTHGKGSKISIKDEIELREYVRKFLISYFLFWQCLNVKYDFQMLQKLDEIYDDHSKYITLASAAYSFISLMNEHEKRINGIIGLSMQEKYNLAVSKLSETLIPKE